MTDATFHLGAEGETNAAEPFDPIAALKAEGIAIPQPIELRSRDERVDELVNEGKSPDVVIEMVSAEFGPRDTPPGPKGINPKDAIGMTKVDLSVVPPTAILHLATAMMDGANKYGPYNWRDNAVIGRVYVAAMQRHILQYLDGEDYDPTSKVHHLGHAMACAAILLDAMETGNLDDNRPPPGPTGQMIRQFTPEDKLSG